LVSCIQLTEPSRDETGLLRVSFFNVFVWYAFGVILTSFYSSDFNTTSFNWWMKTAAKGGQAKPEQGNATSFNWWFFTCFFGMVAVCSQCVCSHILKVPVFKEMAEQESPLSAFPVFAVALTVSLEIEFNGQIPVFLGGPS